MRTVDRAFRLQQDLRVLIPIARRLARKAGPSGITVENVQRWADNHGVLLASTDRGYRSRLLGAVMRAAGLEAVRGVWRRTTRVGTKGGNVVRVWRAA